MKSTVKFVNVIDSSTGRIKAVKIADDDGNLKYEFLVHLFEAGVLVPDEFSTKALREIIHDRSLLKWQYESSLSELQELRQAKRDLSTRLAEAYRRFTEMLDEIEDELKDKLKQLT